eukprot:Hpha_TRINITY_DN3087_c0_g2::TRINITY_DN3087_c0_g2_i1::g.138712::m.138712/K14026/SEL1, SEL1L; SEL1 protein
MGSSSGLLLAVVCLLLLCLPADCTLARGHGVDYKVPPVRPLPGYQTFNDVCIPSGMDLDPLNTNGSPLSLEDARSLCNAEPQCRGFTFMREAQKAIRSELRKGEFWVFLKATDELYAMPGWTAYIKEDTANPTPKEECTASQGEGDGEGSEDDLEDWGEEVSAEGEAESSPRAVELFGMAVQRLEGVDESGTEGLFAAIRDLNDSANLGHPEAQFLLGVFYSVGVGLEPNEALAVLHLTFGALGGSTEASISLGHRHENGLAVERSCQQAARHYRRAAAQVARSWKEGGIAREVKEMYLHDPSMPRVRAHQENIVAALQYRADRGDLNAQLSLGLAFMWGTGGAPQNGALAVKYLEMAERQGSAKALSYLGLIYGNGVPSTVGTVYRDYSTAASYFRRGAKSNHAASVNGLGYLHLRGLGVPKDVSAAIRLFRHASALDSGDAKCNLGLVLLKGLGVARDQVQGVKHLAEAARQGQALATWWLARLYQDGSDGVARDCEAAVRMYKSIINKGTWMKRVETAYNHAMDGNYAASLLHHLVAAETGSRSAQLNAPWLLDLGRGYAELGLYNSNPVFIPEGATPGTEARRLLALKYWKRAAARSSGEALVRLGDMSFYGLGMPVNYGHAFRMYSRATEALNPKGMYSLGYMFEYGLGVAQDFDLARKYYEQALDTSAHAWWPSTMALFKLAFHRFYVEASSPSPPPPSASSSPSSASPSLAEKPGKSARKVLVLGLHAEDFVLCLLVGLLLILLLIRHANPVDPRPL